MLRSILSTNYNVFNCIEPFEHVLDVKNKDNIHISFINTKSVRHMDQHIKNIRSKNNRLIKSKVYPTIYFDILPNSIMHINKSLISVRRFFAGWNIVAHVTNSRDMSYAITHNLGIADHFDSTKMVHAYSDCIYVGKHIKMNQKHTTYTIERRHVCIKNNMIYGYTEPNDSVKMYMGLKGKCMNWVTIYGAYIAKIHIDGVIINHCHDPFLGFGICKDGVVTENKVPINVRGKYIKQKCDLASITSVKQQVLTKSVPWINTPEVSIVLPTYNGYPHIKKTVDSILSQTYTHWSLIIVSDGSTQEKLVTYLSSLNDRRITVVTLYDNMGLPGALNMGIHKCKGTYWTWISDDNLFHKRALEKMANALIVDNNDFVYTDYIYDDTIRHKKSAVSLMQYKDVNGLMDNWKGMPCYMWSMHLVKKVGYFDENIMGIEDYDYVCRTYNVALSPKHIKGTYMHYLNRKNTITHNMGRMKIKSMTKTYNKSFIHHKRDKGVPFVSTSFSDTFKIGVLTSNSNILDRISTIFGNTDVKSVHNYSYKCDNKKPFNVILCCCAKDEEMLGWHVYCEGIPLININNVYDMNSGKEIHDCIAVNTKEKGMIRKIIKNCFNVIHFGSYWQKESDVVWLMGSALRDVCYKHTCINTHIYNDICANNAYITKDKPYKDKVIHILKREYVCHIIRKLSQENKLNMVIVNSGYTTMDKDTISICKTMGVVCVGMSLSDPDVFEYCGKKYASMYDHFCTNAKQCVNDYKKLAKKTNTIVHHIPFACSHVTHKPKDNWNERKDIVIVGGARPDRIKTVEWLNNNTEYTLSIYGGGWPKWCNASKVYGSDQVNAINSGKVYISFCKTIAGHENVKVGLFEAAACGCSIIVDCNIPILQSQFGSYIETYGNMSSLKNILHKLLSNKGALARTNAKNIHRIFRRDHTWVNRWESLFYEMMSKK